MNVTLCIIISFVIIVLSVVIYYYATKKSRAKKKAEEEAEDLRLAFHLANPKRLYETFKSIRLSIDYSFAETSLEELYKM